jgi:hypothetical protein
MKTKKDNYVRVNSRIRSDQDKVIKDIAKSKNTFEGEVLRMVIDYYIKNNH